MGRPAGSPDQRRGGPGWRTRQRAGRCETLTASSVGRAEPLRHSSRRRRASEEGGANKARSVSGSSCLARLIQHPHNRLG